MLTIKFAPTTRAKYWEFLEILWPREWTSLGFLVGEPCNHRRCTVTNAILPTWDAFFLDGPDREDGDTKFYVADHDITIPEFKRITLAMVRAGTTEDVT